MYNVDLANEDCIFDSADDFETLAEVKEWVEKHSGRFRVMQVPAQSQLPLP